MNGDVIGLMFQHMDKGLSAILLIYFVVKLQPMLSRLTDSIEDQQGIVKRLESQSSMTQKDLIRLTERLKYQSPNPSQPVPPQKKV